MKHSLMLLVASTAIGLASHAYAANESAEVKSNVEYKKDGGYEAKRSMEHTLTDGTKVSADSKVDVDVDSNGRVEKTAESESVSDPKGLMNAKKDESETTVKEKARGGYKKTTTKKSHDAAGADVDRKTTTDVDVDANGNVTSTTTVEKSVDPKGLMNAKTTSSKVKAVNGTVVEEKHDH